jgi:Transposase IS66 family
VKNTDETGWSEKGQKRWLWEAATATVAFFVIHLRRNFKGFQALLSETITGVVCSDRWAVYSKLPLELRQICWAHLKRDFQKLIDRGGPAEAIGRVGMEVVECLFADWWAFRRGELDRAGLQTRLDRIARELQEVLEQGRGCADSKAATFCANVLALYPALWLFAAMKGVEPTNNHAERILRLGHAVAEERLWLPQRGGVSVRRADAHRAPDAAVAETPVLDYLYRAIMASVRPSRSAITGPSRGLNGYIISTKVWNVGVVKTGAKCCSRTTNEAVSSMGRLPCLGAYLFCPSRQDGKIGDGS